MDRKGSLLIQIKFDHGGGKRLHQPLCRVYAGRGSNPIRSDMMCGDWLRFHGRRSRIPTPAHPSGLAGRGK
jgi:hypothetical protein